MSTTLPSNAKTIRLDLAAYASCGNVVSFMPKQLAPQNKECLRVQKSQSMDGFADINTFRGCPIPLTSEEASILGQTVLNDDIICILIISVS